MRHLLACCLLAVSTVGPVGFAGCEAYRFDPKDVAYTGGDTDNSAVPPTDASPYPRYPSKDADSGGPSGDIRPPDVPGAEADVGGECPREPSASCRCDYRGKTEGVCRLGRVDALGGCMEPERWEADEFSCDGADNDCDGVVDEDCPCVYRGRDAPPCNGQYVSAETGECMQPASFQDDESACDITDNDCDGVIDEGCGCNFRQTATGVCSEGSIDASGHCLPPGNWEEEESSCDGVDNDCDGRSDEGLTRMCDEQSGVCAGSSVDCANGSFRACTARDYAPAYEADETSCDGRDNDCDGRVDEGLRRKCDNQTGVCRGAEVACSAGSYPECGTTEYGGDWEPSGEVTCDGKDNDCDGEVDEGCDDDGDGWCDAKMRVQGAPGVCPSGPGDCADDDSAVHPGRTEQCGNGIDDDCDAKRDCADPDCIRRRCDGAGTTCVKRDAKCHETACADGNDNDGDGAADCSDPDCDEETCDGSGGTCSNGTCS